MLPDWEWEYCDSCGEELRTQEDIFVISVLPYNIDSANAGESGTLCQKCYTEIRTILKNDPEDD